MLRLGRAINASTVRALAVAAAALPLVPAFTPAFAQTSWPTHEWEAECDVAADCEDAGVVYAAELRRAGEWMESLGFRPPVVERSIVGPWRFYVSEERAGEDHGSYTLVDDRGELVLAPGVFFAMGEPAEDRDAAGMQVLEANTFVAVHELFHAVQERYIGQALVEYDAAVHDWFVEGSADAVMRAYVDHVVGSVDVLMRSRSFDYPIHEPNPALGRNGHYATWYFWRTLGQELGSRDDVAYLADLMLEDLVPHAGVQGLDRFLADRGGLNRTLPSVFARMDATRDFGEQRAWSTSMGPGGTDGEHDVDVPVRKLAATSLRVDLQVRGEQAAIAELRLRDDLPEVHLVVDGSVLFATDTEARNVYTRFVMPGEPQSLDVLVVNASEEAHLSEDADATLELRYIPLACPDGSGGLREITNDRKGVACLEVDVAGAGLTGLRIVANLATDPMQTADEHPRFRLGAPLMGTPIAYIDGPHGDVSVMISALDATSGALYVSDPGGGVRGPGQVTLTVPGQTSPTGASSDRILTESTLRINRYERHPWGWVFSGSFEGELCCFGGVGTERAVGRFFIVETCGPGQFRHPRFDACRRRN